MKIKLDVCEQRTLKNLILRLLPRDTHFKMMLGFFLGCLASSILYIKAQNIQKRCIVYTIQIDSFYRLPKS